MTFFPEHSDSFAAGCSCTQLLLLIDRNKALTAS